MGDSWLIDWNKENKKKRKKKLVIYLHIGWNHKIDQNLMEQTEMDKINQNLG